MEQLSGQDASFLYAETQNTPMHIGSVAIYDPSTAPGGKVRFKEILAHVESRMGGARSFRQKLVRVPFDLDHPYWIEDANFDLEYHVRHIALPAPGDWRQLCIQVARLHSRALDLSKPLWEFWIVEGLDNIEGLPKGCFAVVSKVHHCAIDGMSGVEMTAAVHDLEANPAARPAGAEWKPEKEPAVGELMARSWLNSVRQPMRFAETFAKTVPGIARLVKEVRGGDVTLSGTKLAPKTVLNGLASPHGVWDAVALPLADIRAIKERLPGATVNDAILTVIGGGLRHYLLGRDGLPAESLTAMAPISVRAEGEKAALGNQVSAMVVSLGTHIADPAERLAFIHSGAKNSKAMTNAVGARTLTEYSELIPSGLSALGARLYTRLGLANRHAPLFNCVATNVPGSRVPLYFAGAKMVKMMGFGPIFDGMGLINAIYSYADDIAIGFTSDRTMMPDPANYAAALRRSFEELRDADFAAVKTAPKAKAAAAKAKPVAAKPAPARATRAKAAAPKAKAPVAKAASVRKASSTTKTKRIV
jgi:diacylglycerol O-acyltransferase / wax synthase